MWWWLPAPHSHPLGGVYCWSHWEDVCFGVLRGSSWGDVCVCCERPATNINIKKTIFENRICANARTTCKLAFKINWASQRSVLLRIVQAKNRKYTQTHHRAKCFSRSKYVAADQNGSKSLKKRERKLTTARRYKKQLAEWWRMVGGWLANGGWSSGGWWMVLWLGFGLLVALG